MINYGGVNFLMNAFNQVTVAGVNGSTPGGSAVGSGAGQGIGAGQIFGGPAATHGSAVTPQLASPVVNAPQPNLGAGVGNSVGNGANMFANQSPPSVVGRGANMYAK